MYKTELILIEDNYLGVGIVEIAFFYLIELLRHLLLLGREKYAGCLIGLTELCFHIVLQLIAVRRAVGQELGLFIKVNAIHLVDAGDVYD